MIGVIAIYLTVIAATIHASPMLLELPRYGENCHDGFLPNDGHIDIFIAIDSYFLFTARQNQKLVVADQTYSSDYH